jgi:hypothetical protein
VLPEHQETPGERLHSALLFPPLGGRVVQQLAALALVVTLITLAVLVMVPLQEVVALQICLETVIRGLELQAELEFLPLLPET